MEEIHVADLKTSSRTILEVSKTGKEIILQHKIIQCLK